MFRLFLLLAAILLPMAVFFSFDAAQEERRVEIPPSIKLTDAETKGKLVFAAKGCTGCHSIFGSGGRYAPPLDHVVRDRGTDYVTQWLEDPRSIKVTAGMPKIPLTKEEIGGLVSFLQWVDVVNTSVEEDERKKAAAPQTPPPKQG